jgi:hypothetical protein
MSAQWLCISSRADDVTTLSLEDAPCARPYTGGSAMIWDINRRCTSIRITHIHLDPGEALLLPDLGLGQHIRRPVPADPAIDGARFANFTAEQLPHGHAKDFAFDVPDASALPCYCGRRR